ncbi:MAG: hypothetical protein ACRDGE_06470 [Candidatus Limnocylindria bacterium]
MRAGPSASSGLLARAEAAREAVRAGADPELALSYVISPTRAILAAELTQAPAPRTCAVCSREFTPSRDDAKYCPGGACKQKAYRRRQRPELGPHREAFAT